MCPYFFGSRVNPAAEKIRTQRYIYIYIYARLFSTIYTPELHFFYMDLFDWDSWRVAVTSTSSVTDGESSVTGQKKQARRPDGWSLSLSE